MDAVGGGSHEEETGPVLTRVTTLASIAIVLASALSAAEARSILSGEPSGEFEVDAVLVMIVGPGEGLVGLDPDSRVDFPYVLPWTQRVFVRATITDANGVGVNGRTVTGTLAQPGGVVLLAFTQNIVSGVYNSNEVPYADGEVVVHVAFDLTPETVDKTYEPLPIDAPEPPSPA